MKTAQNLVIVLTKIKTPRMTILRIVRPLCAVAIAFGFLASIVTIHAQTEAAGTISTLDFRMAMRKLWEDHITWTRLYIVSAAADLKDADPTAQRLLQNQDDIGNAIKPFYGNDAGDKLTALLKEHIQGAVDIITAAKASDKTKMDDTSAKWYKNADDIAAFLSGANPKGFPLDDMKSMMKMHLDLTFQEAVDRLSGKYADDIKDYDKVHDEILQMADMLANGIITQFPDKFSS